MLCIVIGSLTPLLRNCAEGSGKPVLLSPVRNRAAAANAMLRKPTRLYTNYRPAVTAQIAAAVVITAFFNRSLPDGLIKICHDTLSSDLSKKRMLQQCLLSEGANMEVRLWVA